MNAEGTLNFQQISSRIVVAVTLSMKRVKRWMCFLSGEDKKQRSLLK